MPNCKKCGHENQEGVRYCQRCGAALGKKARTGMLFKSKNTKAVRVGEQPNAAARDNPFPNADGASLDTAAMAVMMPKGNAAPDSASKAGKDRGFTVPADPCPDGSWFCPDCGAHNAPHARTCNACGRYIR